MEVAQDVRQRRVNWKEDTDDEDLSAKNALPPALETEDTDSACEDLDDDVIVDDVKPIIPQHVLSMADELLSGLSPRWRNWFVRICSGFSLITGFSILVWIGPAGLLFLTYLVVYSSFSEILSLGKRVCNVHDLKTIRLCWFFFGLLEYYLVAPSCGKAILQNFGSTGSPNIFESIFRGLLKHHEAVTFFVYLSAIIFFVLTMETTNYLRRYGLFAWAHLSMFFLCVTGHMMNKATLNGMLWYVIPMTVITINDIAAYMVGFFFGNTPLIKLSPKKTREGFIGGGFLTVILGTIFSLWVSLKPSMTCPVEILPNLSLAVSDCKPAEIFQGYQYQTGGFSIPMNSFFIHGLIISIFSSLVGPCGGFFASGFKRACKRKNFGSFIPGHGGVLDRCDCMFLMAGFTYVYQNILINEGLL